MTTTFRSAEDVGAAVGSELGTTGWLEVTQERVDAFAEATEDRQWIHVDPGRAAAGPFGGTIAHGFLTLSLSSWALAETVAMEGVRMGINYGLNRVRFPAPVPVGRRLRAVVRLAAADPVPGGVQATFELTFEVEGGEKPVCVAEFIARQYW